MTTLQTRGFTLIELSIVLVIIGLIVGGVLVGRDLIRNAQLNLIITERSKFITAVNTYRGKYGQLPGDATNATATWGVASGNASDNYTATCEANSNNMSQGQVSTCNGNGDGMIGCAGVQLYEIPCDQEGFLIWHHLANAKYIQGQYIPSRAANNAQGQQQALETVGLNIPRSQADTNTGWSMWYLCLSGDSSIFSGTACGNKFFYGGQSPTANFNWLDMAFQPALSSTDARRIDQKIDDGFPGRGVVTTFTSDSSGNPFAPNCASSTSPTSATYVTTSNTPTCMLIFNAGF